MKIGLLLQQQRIRHNMSQNDLAEKLHISRQSISKWENGGSLPSFNNAVAINDLFDISLDELIRGDEELMDKLKNDGKIRLNHVETIIFGGIGLGIISLLGLLMSIKWKYIDRSLDKKAEFFGIILLALGVIDFLISFWLGFKG